LNIERIENKKNIKRGRMQKKKRKEKKTQPFVLVLVFKISKESYKKQNKKELPVQHCTHVYYHHENIERHCCIAHIAY
jgi:hypothetical protein